jgi:hypothetical protein
MALDRALYDNVKWTERIFKPGSDIKLQPAMDVAKRRIAFKDAMDVAIAKLIDSGTDIDIYPKKNVPSRLAKPPPRTIDRWIEYITSGLKYNDIKISISLFGLQNVASTISGAVQLNRDMHVMQQSSVTSGSEVGLLTSKRGFGFDLAKGSSLLAPGANASRVGFNVATSAYEHIDSLNGWKYNFDKHGRLTGKIRHRGAFGRWYVDTETLFNILTTEYGEAYAEFMPAFGMVDLVGVLEKHHMRMLNAAHILPRCKWEMVQYMDPYESSLLEQSNMLKARYAVIKKARKDDSATASYNPSDTLEDTVDQDASMDNLQEEEQDITQDDEEPIIIIWNE